MNDPLILVFYIDRDTLSRSKIRETYMSGVSKYFDDLKIQSAIFFMPTTGDERIECINPKYIEDKNEIEKLKKVLVDVERIFQIQSSTKNILEHIPNTIDLDETEEDDEDTVYSDLIEDMRKKIAHYDKKYNEFIQLFIKENRIDKELDLDQSMEIDTVYTSPDVKKGALFNQFLSRNPITKLTSNVFNLIDQIGHYENVVVPFLPAFRYMNDTHIIKKLNFMSADQVCDFILDTTNVTIAIYSVFTLNNDAYELNCCVIDN